MVSQQIINIIIRAENQAEEQAKKVEEQFKRIGNNGKSAFDKVNKSSEKTNQKFQELKGKINETVENVNKVGNNGSQSFRKLNKPQQDAVTRFNMLNKNIQTTIQAIREVGSTEMFPDSGKALNEFSQMNNLTRSWSGSMDYAKTKMELLGNNTSTLRGKIQTTGIVIQTYLGTKWDLIKNKVKSVSESIKGTLGGAIDSIKGKMNGLSSKFNMMANSVKGAGKGFGFLRQAASMTVGMIGYDLVNAFTQSARANINAQASIDAFGKRIGKSASEIQSFKTDLSGLQTEFRKVDMDAVGASALEMGVKFGMAKDDMTELSRTVAITSSAFVNEGRTQEDAILAVSDAMDGQLKRLLELGIDEQKLIDNGFKGDYEDKNNLLQALNNTLSNMGFEETAKQVKTLDDAYAAISVTGGQLLSAILVPLTPYIVLISNAFYDVVVKVKGFITAMQDAWTNMPDWQKAALLIGGVALAVSALALAIKFNLIPGVAGSALSFITAEASSFLWMVTNMGLTTTLGFLATAIWSAVSAVLAFVAPILIAVAVIGALVFAIFEVGKAFGWWTDIGSMLDAIKTNIGRLWDAFINHPDVQATIKGIQDAWKGLNEFLKPVVDWLHGIWDMMFPPSAKGKVDGTRIIIDAIGKAFQAVTLPIRTVIGVLQALYNFALPIGQGIWNALKPIVCILLGCSPGIVPALQKVQEIFLVVWSWISSFIIGIVSNVVDGIRPVLDVLSAIGNFLLFAFQYAWQTIIMVFNIVMGHVNVLINIFSRLLSGQLSLSSALGMIWNVIKSLFISVLGIIISRVGIFARSLISKALEAGKGFVNNILNFIKNLPGNIGTILLNIVSRIVSAGASWISAGIGVASSMVNGVINNVSQLPGKVYNEFINIGSRIMSAGSDLVNKAKDIGKNIVDGLLGAMGIHSPGIIQTKVVTEFKDTLGGVEEQMKPAGELAKTFGETMVDQFGTLQFDTNSLYTDLDMPKMNMDIGMDTSSVNSTNNMVATSYDSLANATGSSLQSMIDKDKNAYNLIRNNDATQLSAITANLQNKMNTMSNKVKTSMDTMLNKNKTGLNSARNTTQTQLTNITNATVKANQKMIESWKIMKTGIVDAANKIKTDSTNHFNKLEGTIGGFYRKLQNPGGFGAGPGTGRVSTVKRTGANGFKRIANVMKQYSMPSYISLGEIRRNPFISTDNIGEYITPNKNNLYSVNDLLKSGNIRIPVGLTDPKNKGAGKWTDGVGKHVQKIKDTSKNWGMKGPKIIGKYQTSKGFKVSDFINGTPQIDFATFKQMAEDVFGQTHYDFYYDNDKHGNWMGALRAGYLNCYHGAQALIAFANACGLSGNLVHGHWNKFGHFWANIAGHKMDVTGWQQQRNWTPAASHAGPAPKTWSLEDLFDELKSALTGDENQVVVENNSGQVSLDGEFKIIHEFLNLHENISEAEIVRLIEESTSTDSWIRKLVENVVFQKLDLKQKSRIEARTNRSRGAI